MKAWIDYAIRRVPIDAKTVLDVGIGHGEPVANLIFARDPERIVGIEWFEPYAKRLQRIYDEILVGDANEILPTLPSNSFDVVLALEVIEHQTREEAIRMIEECERIGKFVILSSPNKFYRGEEADGNIKQLHRCVVRSQEMRKRGYTLRGQDFDSILPVWKFTRLVPHLNRAWLGWKATP